MDNKEKSYSIAVGLDGSNSSWKALEEAMCQALQKGAMLHVVSIHEMAEASYSATEILEVEKTSLDKLKTIQLTAGKQVEKHGLKATMAIVSGPSATKLAEYVKKNNIDLLVVGDTGHSSIWGALLGTTAEKIVRHASCSVLVVR